jgi:hypothetical protein
MAKKTVTSWEKKGWTRLNLPANEFVQVIYDSEAQNIVLKGQVFDTNGKQVTGPSRPKLSLNETPTGCAIIANAATTTLYKLVDQDEDEAEVESEAEAEAEVESEQT